MKRIHLIGICGTAMATLAAMLKSKGYDVRGSDQNVYPPMSDFLVQQGITTFQGYSARATSARISISSSSATPFRAGTSSSRKCSIARSATARCPRRSATTFSGPRDRSSLPGHTARPRPRRSTGWLLTHGGADPSVFIGGIAENFESSYRIGGGREFVIEGDEYDSAFFDKTAKFLKYLPDIAVVNNIEFDHADIYPDLDAIRLAFRRLVNLVPRRGLLLLGADNADALALKPHARCRVETFGLSAGSDWQAHDLKIAATSTTFGVRRAGSPSVTFELPLLGAYNVRNALAAIAVGAAVGLSTDTMAEGLRQFRGVRRRLQHRGTAAGVAVYDDFAHHPTAIGETLDGVRSAYPDRRIWAIFEPRSATSCRRIFQSEFARALARADRVILPAVFRSSVPEGERLSAEALIADLQAEKVDARYIPDVADIVRTVAKEARSGDLIVVMSNGGFDDIHQKLLSALEARASK